MHSTRVGLLAISFLMAVSVLRAGVEYTVGMSRPSTHLFEVTMKVGDLTPADSLVELVLPVWRSGRYVRFDFAGGIQRFSAADAHGAVLDWRKTDKTTWVIRPKGARAVVARYQVYANEFTLRTRGLDEWHGFIDATAVLMYATAQRHTPVRLQIMPPSGWHVTTGLEPVEGVAHAFQAPDYDVLADCPLEIGTQRDYRFDVRGIPHVLSIAGRTNCVPESLIVMARRIVEINADFWGGLPYQRYVFLLRALPGGGGGTEHWNSCVLDIASTTSRAPDDGKGLLGLFSHEFFHTWNVKRLRPKGMHPYDWRGENYYQELWLAEGGTSYMDGLLLVRGGMGTAADFVRGIAGQARSDRQRPGNREQSVAACSFDAWVKYNQPTAASYNFETDIYEKGAQVSMLLDLVLRHATRNQASFDVLLREMLRRFPSDGPGYTLDDLEALAVELGGPALHNFFQNYIRGTAPLPWEEVLGYAGVELLPVARPARAWLGVDAGGEAGSPMVRTVVAGSPAAEAGVDVGDQLLAIDGLRLRGAELSRRIGEYAPGDTIQVSFFRGDELKTRHIVLMAEPVPTYTCAKKKTPPTAEERAVYEAWLGHSWDE